MLLHTHPYYDQQHYNTHGIILWHELAYHMASHIIAYTNILILVYTYTNIECTLLLSSLLYKDGFIVLVESVEFQTLYPS